MKDKMFWEGFVRGVLVALLGVALYLTIEMSNTVSRIIDKLGG